jgi:hypothetical protein
MRRKIISKLPFFLILVLALAVSAISQTARRGSVQTEKEKIILYLKRTVELCRNPDARITVDSAKVSPEKTGFIGQCKYGGGPSILLEKAAGSYRKLLAVDTGMNGYFYMEKSIHNGYYDVSNSERGGNEVSITTYRWDGSKYVAQKEKISRIPCNSKRML